VLERQNFADAFLNPLHAFYSFGERIDIGDGARLRQRRDTERPQGTLGIGIDLANLARGFGIGIEHRNVDTVQREPRGPASADNAAADDGCFGETGHGDASVCVCLRRYRWQKMQSRGSGIFQARSVTAGLVAKEDFSEVLADIPRHAHTVADVIAVARLQLCHGAGGMVSQAARTGQNGH